MLGQTRESARRNPVGPLATLFFGSAGAAVLCAVANTLTLASHGSVARLRQLEVLAILIRFANKYGLDQFVRLPSFTAFPWELSRPAALVQFAGAAILVGLVISSSLALVLALPVRWLARRHPPNRTAEAGNWFWDRAYPAGVLVAFSIPGIQALLHGLLHRPVFRPISASTTAASLLAWIVLSLWLRARRNSRRLVRLWVLSALAACLVTVGCFTGALVLAAPAAGHDRPLPPPGTPNIFLVSIDSLRADHLHCYGCAHETSPAIDRVAREGARFERVVAPSSWTLPSHLTLLTALPPEGHGVIDYGLQLRPETTSLAQALQRAGYATAGFVSGPLLTTEYGFSRGFDLYDDWSIALTFPNSNHHGVTSPTLVKLADDWLDGWSRQTRPRPFFLFLHMWDVHYDYSPPPPFDSLFDPDYHGDINGVHYDSNDRICAGMERRDLEHVIALYDGGIRFTDFYLGKVLEQLRRLGALDDTIVAVTADHGDEFFEHGEKAHMKALYDETVLVPLVVRFPRKVPAGRVVPRQVRLMDVAPTLLALAGVQPPPGFGALDERTRPAATDLSPLLAAGSPTEPAALLAFSELQGRLASVRTGRFTFIKALREAGAEELYDSVADPGERHDIAAGNPALAGTLRSLLLGWRNDWSGRTNQAQRFVQSEEQIQRLRSLGYVQ